MSRRGKDNNLVGLIAAALAFGLTKEQIEVYLREVVCSVL
jgi:hypothetical protein